jgi:integrase
MRDCTKIHEWDGHMVSDGYAKATRKARIEAVEAFAYFCQVPPESLTDYHVRLYLQTHQLSPWTRLAYLRHLRAWAAFLGVPDPTAEIRRPRQPRRIPNPLSEAQLAVLLDVVAGDERAWVLLGAYAGLRAHEAAKLHPRDWDDGTLRVLGKGGRVDALPIAPVLAEALRPYTHLRGPCFPDVDARGVSGRVQRRALKAGIRMRYHMLRHRFGTAVYAATHDLLLTQQLMRHVSPQTTAGYAAVANARSTHIVASLPGGS